LRSGSGEEERREEIGEPARMAWWRGEKGVRGPSGESEEMIRRASRSEVEKTPDGRVIISRATMIVDLSGCIHVSGWMEPKFT
jgi:hypothetical protein